MALFRSTPKIERERPTLDAGQPADVRTATFALG